MIEDTSLVRCDSVNFLINTGKEVSGVVGSLGRLPFDISVPRVASGQDRDSSRLMVCIVSVNPSVRGVPGFFAHLE